MKNYSHQIAVLACAALALCGCVKEGWVTGRAIRFGAGSQAESLTKTAYGDITTDSGTGKRTHQMVDWKEGDVIRIVCEQASTAETGTSTSADYKTSAGTKSGTESRAKLSLASNNDKGLRWGSTELAHVFYAVYPSPQVKSGTSLTVEGAFTGIIPESQSVASVSGTSPSFVAAPDMTNQYMVAKRTVAAGTQEISEEEVFLNFTPVTTAIEFEIKNGMDGALGISSIELISAASYLSGTFTSSLEGLNENGLYPSGYPGFTAGSDKKKTAKVDFGTSGRTLAVGDILTLTVFLLPESDLGDLTFRINKLDGTYIQTALKSDASTWIGFERCKKHFIHGLLVQDGAKWTLAFDPDVAPWDGSDILKDLNDPEASGNPSLSPWEEGEGGSLPLTKPAEYAFSIPTGAETQTFSNPSTTAGKVKTITVTSTKDPDGDGTVVNPQDWKISTVGGQPVTGDGSTYTTSDGLLKVEKNADGKLVITDNRTTTDKGSHSYWAGSNGDWSPASWDGKGAIDLSKNDVLSNDSGPVARSMRTANCYIIRHAGTYTIPLVYGNAIDYVKNSTNGYNTSAYAPGGSGTNTLGTFVDYSNHGIINPYIENNTTDGSDFHKNRRLKPSNAIVVWQDVASVLSNVSFTGQTNGDNQCNGNNCGYITFQVAPNTICQCNALIAVKDASDNIMWSWHIWVTNDPAVKSSGITAGSYTYFPAPCIGWIEPPFYEGKDDMVVTLIQDESDETLDVTVKRPEYHHQAGTGTYYQFGRKDPRPSRDGVSGFNIGTNNLNTGASLGGGIQYANYFYCRDYSNPNVPGSGGTNSGDWCSSSYDNLWTGTSSGIKTIYDPSPVGYKVPAPAAFYGFCTENVSSTDKSNWVYDGTAMGVLKGYTFTPNSVSLFFPASGFIAYATYESSGISYTRGIINRLGQNAYFWANTPKSSDKKYGNALGFSSSYVNTHSAYVRADGLPVRPVTE